MLRITAIPWTNFNSSWCKRVMGTKFCCLFIRTPSNSERFLLEVQINIFKNQYQTSEMLITILQMTDPCVWFIYFIYCYYKVEKVFACNFLFRSEEYLSPWHDWQFENVEINLYIQLSCISQIMAILQWKPRAVNKAFQASSLTFRIN